MSGLSPDDLSEIQRISEQLRSGTYYDVFGLGLDFEKGDLRSAYYDLSRRFHPDRFFRKDLAGLETVVEEVFAGINEAYRVLGDSGARARYDREMQEKKRKPHASPTKARPSAEPPTSPGLGSAASVKTEPPAHGHVVHWARPQAPPPPPPTPPPPPPKPSSPGLDKMRQQILERLKKAKMHFREGEQHEASGNALKAANAFYLATQFDPNNEEYKKRFADANRKSKDQQVNQALEKARKAESFRSMKEAEHHYELAANLDPPVGEPFYRLAQMKLQNDGDKRAALSLARKAVEKEPRNVDFNLLLAQIYEQVDLKKNANRIYAAILEIKRDHAEAREGLKRTRS